MTIATLNYDTSIEVAAKVENLWTYRYQGETPEAQTNSEDFIDYLKLHGSIDWCSGNEFFREDDLPQEHVITADEEQMTQKGYRPAVIFGQRNKLTAQGPFLRLFVSFQEQMNRVTDLVVIGYSFRDDHINETIAAWFNHDVHRTITIVTPNEEWSKESDFAGRLGRLVAAGRVTVVAKKASEAIPELFSDAVTS